MNLKYLFMYVLYLNEIVRISTSRQNTHVRTYFYHRIWVYYTIGILHLKNRNLSIEQSQIYYEVWITRIVSTS